jgi:hypothetical protein
MTLEIVHANTVRLLGSDNITLADAGVSSSPAPTVITCALPSINRTAILAGVGLAVCTYLVFHPSSASSASSSSSSSLAHDHHIKTQILFCVAAHTLVNRRFDAVMSFAIRRAP